MLLRIFILICTLSPSFAANALSLDESRMFLLVNQYRQQHGLTALEIDASLQLAAQNHSQWMAQTLIFEHEGPEPTTTSFARILQAGFNPNYSFLGENIAAGYETADETFAMWIESPGHLANILHKGYQYMGISRAESNGQGGMNDYFYYWTQTFGAYRSSP